MRMMLTAVIAVMASAAHAEQKNLTVVAGFPPGGPSTIIARHVADSLAKTLGVAAIVENRPGAAGRVASDHVKRTGADGRTLLVLASTSTLKLEPGSGLVAIGRVSRFDFVFVQGKAFSTKTLDEYLATVRARADLTTYTTPGTGTIPHLLMEELARMRDLPLRHVPFQGSGPAMQSVLGGHVSAALFGISEVQPAIESGLLPIFVTGNQRSAKLPQTPTLIELGYDLDASGWHALYAHKDVSAEWSRRLSAAVSVAADSLPPALIELGFAGAATSPEAMEAIHSRDYRRWMKVNDRLGLQQ